MPTQLSDYHRSVLDAKKRNKIVNAQMAAIQEELSKLRERVRELEERPDPSCSYDRNGIYLGPIGCPP